MSALVAEFAGEPLRREYDGRRDDLLTAGLGLDGLRAPPPAFKDPLHPTTHELRRRAIHAAYRGLVDTSDAGGFGRLHGPVGDLRIAGTEILAAVRTPDGHGITTVMLQVPASFDAADPRLLAVASSGSRGIYGALPTAGEWGLRNGFAVVHTDKGTGTGAWDLDRGRGYRIDGVLTRDLDDPLLSFAPELTPELAAFARARPGTVLMKHAHSGQNPEADWGTYLLQAISAAFVLLNRELGRRRAAPLGPRNTLVLAAGISNGGAAVLRALEQDRAGWISGAVASEPNVVLANRADGIAITSGTHRVGGEEISPADYSAMHHVLQPCAVLAEHDAGAPFAAVTAAVRPALERWCAAVAAAGFVPSGDAEAVAHAARERLLAAGILPEALRLGHFNLTASLWPALAVTYGAAYARSPPWDPPGGISFAATTASGAARPLTDEEAAALWADSSGIAPTAGIALVRPDASGACRATDPGCIDLALEAAPPRLRVAGAGTGTGTDPRMDAILAGRAATAMTATPGNRPVILLHGRADSLIPVNHGSRAYYAINRLHRGTRDELHYYEVEHGQHFDNCLTVPEFAASYVPLQPWLARLLDALHARLTQGRALPPSQVIRSRARGASGGSVPPLESCHLGELRADPGVDAITFDAAGLHVPP